MNTPRHALHRLLASSFIAALAICASGCGNGAGPVDAASSDQSSPGTDSGNEVGSDTAAPATCSTDPLHTGLTAQQTGVSVDAFDCEILRFTAMNHEPDAMIFKAIIYVESRFDHTSVACPNLPCGMPMGWTAAESGCYGLMQIVPACFHDPATPGLLANGHPNLTTDMSSGSWAGSVFNPEINVALGIAGIAGNRVQVQQQFPGCTEEQYTLMAIGNYNSYGSTRSCTQYNTDYDNLVLMAYRQYAAAAGYAVHSY